MAPRGETLTRKNQPISPLGLVAPPPIHVESPKFTGSLAALFVCVRERKIDLLDVPLFPICEAYFLYLLDSSRADLDEAGAALAALAYLLERKAWALLPTPEPEPEHEEALELAAPSVHEYVTVIEALKIWHEEREQRFFRNVDPSTQYEVPIEIGDVTPCDLARALERVLQKAKPEPFEPLAKPRRSLTEQMGIVLAALDHEWRPLERLAQEPYTRSEIVWWFLALLELIRLGRAKVKLAEEDVLFMRGSTDPGQPKLLEAGA
jgi:segregation and condensation protein A